METPDYDRIYSKEEKPRFGFLPRSLILPLLWRLPSQASVLDIGCGEGQNANPLALRGINVTAVDESGIGLQKVKTLYPAALRALIRGKIQTVQADILDYLEKDNREYNATICMHVLQFLPQEKISRVIGQIQNRTAPGGYTAIASFLEDPEIPECADSLKEKKLSYLPEGLLRQLFSNWDIKKYRVRRGKIRTPPMPVKIVELLARKV